MLKPWSCHAHNTSNKCQLNIAEYNTTKKVVNEVAKPEPENFWTIITEPCSLDRIDKTKNRLGFDQKNFTLTNINIGT